jgi:polyisoprenoid-binding protein YceI
VDQLHQGTRQRDVNTASFDSNDDNRDAHVKSADLFDVEQFPRMSFRSVGTDGGADQFRLAGELTIKDTTLPVEFDVEFLRTLRQEGGHDSVYSILQDHGRGYSFLR